MPQQQVRSGQKAQRSLVGQYDNLFQVDDPEGLDKRKSFLSMKPLI